MGHSAWIKAVSGSTLLLLLLALLVLLGSAGDLRAQETSPTELLTAQEWPMQLRRGDQRYVKHVLAAYDPATGQRRELAAEEFDIVPQDKRMAVIAPSGDSLLTIVLKPTYSIMRKRGTEQTVASLPMNADVQRMIAHRSAARILEPSPDGRGWVMLVGDTGLIMHHEQTTRTFDLNWIDWESGLAISDPTFSWSPDSRKVAFYYAYAEGMRAQQLVRDFGIALLTLDDGVVELVKPSGRGTVGLGTEVIPLPWSSDSQYVYFVQGPLPGEKVPAQVFPAFTYRVDIRTGQEEKLTQGAVTSVAPDDSYLLMTRYCVPTDKGKMKLRSAKLDLRTREVTTLPQGIASPRISPSGRYVAAMCRDKERFVVRFFDASDWSMISDTGPVRRIGSMAEWFTFWRWITLDEPSPPAVPTTQP